MEIEKHWKEWSSICRLMEKEETFPITKAQLFDFAESYSKKQTDSFIDSLDNKIYNRIRKSHGNAECRRVLKEHLIKQLENIDKELKQRLTRYPSFEVVKWIALKDEKPIDGREYLISDGEDVTEAQWYDDSKWGGYPYDNYTHYCEKPNPPVQQI